MLTGLFNREMPQHTTQTSGSRFSTVTRKNNIFNFQCCALTQRCGVCKVDPALNVKCTFEDADAVAPPPCSPSGFKSRIREIFGEGAASDAGRSAILRRVSLVDPRDPFPCARWIGGHGSRPPAGRAESYARDAGVGLEPAYSLRRQLLPWAVPCTALPPEFRRPRRGRRGRTTALRPRTPASPCRRCPTPPWRMTSRACAA